MALWVRWIGVSVMRWVGLRVGCSFNAQQTSLYTASLYAASPYAASLNAASLMPRLAVHHELVLMRPLPLTALKIALAKDPQGVRTVGVVTKCDMLPAR